jgi:hypothetical protein
MTDINKEITEKGYKHTFEAIEYSRTMRDMGASFEIDNVLTIAVYRSKYYWALQSDFINKKWHEIPAHLYKSLLKYHEDQKYLIGNKESNDRHL